MSNICLNGLQLLEMNITELPTLVDPILPKYGIAGVVGSSDTGKSSFLRQLALANAMGQGEFLGFKMNSTHCQSVYVSTEDDEIAISALLNKSKGRYGDLKRFENIRFIFGHHDLFNVLDKLLTELPADLVIIDAFSDIFPGDMNMVNKVRTFLDEFQSLSRKHKCLFIILHHTGKRTQNLLPSKDNVLGSQGFEGKMRTVLDIRKDPKSPKYRHLCIVKGNYISEDNKTSSFKFSFESDLTYKPTNERTPFEGMTYEDISTTMSKEGFKYCSRSTIGNWMKSHDTESIQPEP
jgi:RecA-family ATPase